ncbi:hypothetical protein [Sphingobacterium sp.]|uniref:hypothetical protein n=1 Tax=Sphingobacterium sp. TaxID=341027 RepID=UPI00289DBCFC|nr:hypothetical protein [Sphingobacterium sp.]
MVIVDFKEDIVSCLNRFDSNELLFDFYLVSSYYDKSLHFAKKENYNEACRNIDIGDQLINEITYASDIIELMEVYCFPKKAYYLYRKGDLIQAKLLTEQVVQYTERLVRRGEVDFLFVLVQQKINLASLYRSPKQLEKRIAASFECIVVLAEASVIAEASSRQVKDLFKSVDDHLNQVLNKTLSYFIQCRVTKAEVRSYISALNTLLRKFGIQYLASEQAKETLLFVDEILILMDKKNGEDLSPRFLPNTGTGKAKHYHEMMTNLRIIAYEYD